MICSFPSLQLSVTCSIFNLQVENLYFVYLFTLRAVQKAAPLLKRLEYQSGCSDDSETAHLVSKLVRCFALCPKVPRV